MTSVKIKKGSKIIKKDRKIDLRKSAFLEKLQKAKEASDIYLDNILRILPSCIYWMDKNGCVLGCNEAQAKTFGMTSDELIGKTIFDVAKKLGWDKSVPEAVHANNLEVIKNGKTVFFEEVNGAGRTFLSHKAPLRNKNGKIIGLVGHSMEVSDMKRVEQELRQAKEKAEIANKVKQEFIVNMEHDMRTPLLGVAGVAEILAREERNRDKKEYLLLMAKSASGLLKYCEEILEYARLQSYSHQVHLKKFNLRQLINKAIAMDAAVLEQKGLKFVLDYPQVDHDSITSDSFRIERILHNLIGNAIKFTNSGKVKLSVSIAPAGKLQPKQRKLWNRLDGKEDDKKQLLLVLAVTDTGIGISEDKLEYIFEVFAKLSPSNREEYKGLGFGLPLVQQFTRELGGLVSVESTVGKGSAFTCLIPIE